MNAEAYTAAASAVPRRARTRTVSGAALVSGATLVSGVLTYAFHVLAARTLGPEGYGRIAVLWAVMFLGAVVLYRPIEQTISRAIADRRERGEEVRTVLVGAGVVAVGTFLLVLAAAAAAWGLLAGRLFGGDSALAAFLVGGVILYGVAYLIRGLVGGVCWFGGYAAALVGDSVVRIAVALPLVVVASRTIAGAAVVAAAAGGIVVPFAVGRARLLPLLRRDGGGRPFGARAAFAFAAPAGVVAGADQLLVNGGPILVAAGGGAHASRAAGIVFAATMLVRVAVYVFTGLAAVLLPNLTKLYAADAIAFKRAVVRTGGVLLAFGAVLVLVTVSFGPRGMSLLYGSGFSADRLELGLLGAGVAFYLAASTCSQALLAIDSARPAAAAWAGSAALFVALYFVASGTPLLRVAIAFACALLCDLLVVAALLGRRTRV
jgi:O-antigen/teichoic acid export membrane protein